MKVQSLAVNGSWVTLEQQPGHPGIFNGFNPADMSLKVRQWCYKISQPWHHVASVLLCINFLPGCEQIMAGAANHCDMQSNMQNY
jgi:hypothetical protein